MNERLLSVSMEQQLVPRRSWLLFVCGILGGAGGGALTSLIFTLPMVARGMAVQAPAGQASGVYLIFGLVIGFIAGAVVGFCASLTGWVAALLIGLYSKDRRVMMVAVGCGAFLGAATVCIWMFSYVFPGEYVAGALGVAVVSGVSLSIVEMKLLSKTRGI